ncbi:putative LRR receptor-like serine/threonine-protein kinase [Gossypium australe]|uniref:Putative LRR receptor-like serine/threonine-protein kinase n=1 Tax=Gossypium australe TaxID=47621 RepID=A0A5B6WGB1_9ROSI|nr:putative LRR receptor-like serine/threonine-protein kinase [Gossypium australe]
MGRGQRAPSRGAGQTEARQPVLVYAACCREDGDAPDVITVHIGSTNSYIACSVSENLGLSVESTSSEVIVISPLGQSI